MDQETKQFFKRLAQQPGNGVCIDCDAAHPQWASISYGTYFCLNCSGVHRSLGVHLSFVRSISMDTWSEKQKKMMELGGNAAFKKFAIDQGIDKFNIRDKYNTVAAEYYRNMLKAKYDGTPAPALPAAGAGKNLTGGGAAQSKPMGGFGSGGPAQGFGSGGPSSQPQNSASNRDYGLSYQGGNNSNPYSYPGGSTGGGQGDLFSGVTGFLQSAVTAGNQFAEQAGQKFNEAKNQAKDDGWFDFDQLQSQASQFANQAAAKASELAGGSSTPPRTSGTVYSSGGGAPSGQYQGFGNNSAPNSSVQSSLPRPTMSSVTASPAPSSASSAPVAQKPINALGDKSPPRVDRKQPNISLTPPDLSKSASNAKSGEGDKKDLWDTDAWFDEM